MKRARRLLLSAALTLGAVMALVYGLSESRMDRARPGADHEFAASEADADWGRSLARDLTQCAFCHGDDLSGLYPIIATQLFECVPLVDLGGEELEHVEVVGGEEDVVVRGEVGGKLFEERGADFAEEIWGLEDGDAVDGFGEVAPVGDFAGAAGDE